MLENYYCDEAGKLLEEYPSYYQFRYYYRKYNKPSTEMISRNTLSYYQRNQRTLVGNGVQRFAGTIGMGMLDAKVNVELALRDLRDMDERVHDIVVSLL